MTLPLVELGGLAAGYIDNASDSPPVPDPPRFDVSLGVTTAKATSLTAAPRA
ncbi:hypothetical protein [Pseudarthrobacter sp.]|uniref:hypothetical protein n=1 Tax=Pseudarthrobacter sp. TaxID=1934409 RepID=UPI002FC827FA